MSILDLNSLLSNNFKLLQSFTSIYLVHISLAEVMKFTDLFAELQLCSLKLSSEWERGKDCDLSRWAFYTVSLKNWNGQRKQSGEEIVSGGDERVVPRGYRMYAMECFWIRLFLWEVSLLSDEGEDWNFGRQWKHQIVSCLFQPLCVSFRAPWGTNSCEQLYLLLTYKSWILPKLQLTL